METNQIPMDYRKLVVGTETKVPLSNGSLVTSVNFDNAATTPAFFSVLKEVNDLSPWYSSIHRGKGYKSQFSSEIYENGRQLIKSFVNADPENDIVIYTKNTTDSINILSYVLSQKRDGRNVVLSTWMEHAANDLPWRDRFILDYIETDRYGRLSLEDLEARLSRYRNKVKLVTVTGASNVTGYLNPVNEIAALVHRYGSKLLVDGAQLVPHKKVDMKSYDSPEHIDYLAFSAHKMYAPFGAGVLVGPQKTFEQGVPYCKGGSAIKLITHKRVEWEEPPQKDEAGTPNLIGVAAMLSAINTLNGIGLDNVLEHEKALLRYAADRMREIPGIIIYNHPQMQETIGIIPFNLEGLHHHLIAAILSYEAGIAARSGFFCSHPYCERLLSLSERDMEYFFQNPDAPLPGMVRVSFGLYNNYGEIDRLIYALNYIAANKKHYIDKDLHYRSLYNISNKV